MLIDRIHCNNCHSFIQRPHLWTCRYHLISLNILLFMVRGGHRRWWRRQSRVGGCVSASRKLPWIRNAKKYTYHLANFLLSLKYLGDSRNTKMRLPTNHPPAPSLNLSTLQPCRPRPNSTNPPQPTHAVPYPKELLSHLTRRPPLEIAIPP